MKISEMVKELLSIQEDHGDLEVELKEISYNRSLNKIPIENQGDCWKVVL